MVRRFEAPKAIVRAAILDIQRTGVLTRGGYEGLRPEWDWKPTMFKVRLDRLKPDTL
jgi:hypothetical protein